MIVTNFEVKITFEMRQSRLHGEIRIHSVKWRSKNKKTKEIEDEKEETKRKLE